MQVCCHLHWPCDIWVTSGQLLPLRQCVLEQDPPPNTIPHPFSVSEWSAQRWIGNKWTKYCTLWYVVSWYGLKGQFILGSVTWTFPFKELSWCLSHLEKKTYIMYIPYGFCQVKKTYGHSCKGMVTGKRRRGLRLWWKVVLDQRHLSGSGCNWL